MTVIPMPRPVAQAESALRRRLDGSYEIDDWGLDPELVELVSPLVGLHWEVDAQWAGRLPADGPAGCATSPLAGWVFF